MARVHRNALAPGREVNGYTIDRVLGQGGFGITYLAREIRLDRLVAIKEYLPQQLAIREGDMSVHPSDDTEGELFKWGLERFLAEARTLAQFQHPNIVPVFAAFEANNTGYMVMQYERGESLGDILQRRKVMEEDELLKLLLPILGGLREVHARSFIHRDIKPDNIFIRENGSPVLLDFGSSRQALGVKTQIFTVLISTGYSPFEQYSTGGKDQGPWTDIYGLAATLYRAVVGKKPPDAADRSHSILAREEDLFISLQDLVGGRFSTRFLAAIDHGLAFRPHDRPQSVDAWLAEFNDVDGDWATVPRPVDPGAQTIPSLTNYAASRKQASPASAAGPAQREPTAPPTAGKAEVRTEVRTRSFWRRYRVLATVVLASGFTAALVTGLIDVQSWLTTPQPSPVASSPAPAPSMQMTPPAAPASRPAGSLEDLLAAAESDFQSMRYSAPAGDNALEKFRTALLVDPSNQAARAGIQRIVDRFVQLAQQSADAADFTAAERHLDEAAAVAPDAPNLALARTDIGARRAAAERAAAEAEERAANLAAAIKAAETAAQSAEQTPKDALAALATAVKLGATPEQLSSARASLKDRLSQLLSTAAEAAKTATQVGNVAKAREALGQAKDYKTLLEKL